MSETENLAQPKIPFAEVSELDAKGRAIHDRIAGSIGFVPNSMRTYLHRPEIAAAFMGLSAAVYGQGEDSLPRRVQMKLGMICSAVNGCAYCTSHQCNAAQNSARQAANDAGLSDDEVAALVSGEDVGGDPVERACFAYARTASSDPRAVSGEMLEELKAVLTPAQIVELAAIVGVWKLFNTIHDSLHLPIEDAMVPYRRFFEERR